MARKKRRGGHRLSRSKYAEAVCHSCSTLKHGRKKKRRKTKHKKSR